MTRVDGKNPGGGWKKSETTARTGASSSAKKSRASRFTKSADLGPGRHIVRRLLSDWVTASISYNILSYDTSTPGYALAVAWVMWVLLDVVGVVFLGTSPVKWALGLVVRGSNGAKPTIEQALKRFVVKATPASIATAAVLMAGDYNVFNEGGIPQVLVSGAAALQVVMVLWMVRDDAGLGTHDHVANTQILRTR